MTDHEKEISSLAAEFERCRKILLALGDENRQHLILEMMQMGECGGVRVGCAYGKFRITGRGQVVCAVRCASIYRGIGDSRFTIVCQHYGIISCVYVKRSGGDSCQSQCHGCGK